MSRCTDTNGVPKGHSGRGDSSTTPAGHTRTRSAKRKRSRRSRRFRSDVFYGLFESLSGSFQPWNVGRKTCKKKNLIFVTRLFRHERERFFKTLRRRLPPHKHMILPVLRRLIVIRHESSRHVRLV